MSTSDPNTKPAPLPRRTRLIRRTLLVGIPLVVVVVAGLMSIFGGRYVSTENAYIGAPLIKIAPEVSGQISEVRVEENQLVRKGDLMLQIDPAPYRIAVDHAKAELAKAANDIRTLEASYATRQEDLSLAEENVAFAKRELARQQALAKRQLTSESELEKYRHDYTTARREQAAIERDLKRIATSLGGKVDLPVEQHPDYQVAKANLEQAELDLEHTHIRAPFDGIAAKTPDPGAYARASASVMGLVGNRNLWIDANFKETDLTRVKPGQAVSIEVDTYPDREFHGHVASIAQATGAEFSVLPAQNATGNWVKVVQRIPVRIRFDDLPADIGLRAGMSTIVEIDTGYPDADVPLVGWLRGLVSKAHAEEPPAE
ncbi:HlyD family secretion protein [Marinobacter mangrovi]|uniref:HlyD family secretion protein n=1 Tax=Marinobacter mangrovi TaxID=2803918 RepID=UPI001933659C|nr:HlyD family secretion protein [Marinobacter mangrovi]